MFMKKLSLLFAFASMALQISAQIITIKGRKAAEIKSTGDILIDGNVVGIYERNGDVYKKGELIGVLKPNGEFWIGGAKSGKIEFDGSVVKAGKKIGKVENNGDVYIGETLVANGRGVKKEWLAGLFFFYFREELPLN
jgi:hypothetical protein